MTNLLPARAPRDGGDGTPGDIKGLVTTAGLSLQFDFTSHFAPGDRLLMIDVDTAEQYQIQAFVKTGFAYTQVPLTGWVVSNYAGSTQQAPVAGTLAGLESKHWISCFFLARNLDEIPGRPCARSGGGSRDYFADRRQRHGGRRYPVHRQRRTIGGPVELEIAENGDFSAGNTTPGGYTLSTTFGPGLYGLTTNPQSINPGEASFGDHTTGTGLMMVVDGSTNQTRLHLKPFLGFSLPNMLCISTLLWMEPARRSCK